MAEQNPRKAAESAPEAPVVSRQGVDRFAVKPSDAKIDPRTGEKFATPPGLKGVYGVDLLSEGVVVPGVDPDRIPAEASPGVSPDSGGDRLLAAAQAKAPSLTKEFVKAMELDDETLGQIARGEIPPPPTPGPIHSADMYRTPGGYQQVPPGTDPAHVGANAIGRA